MADYNSSYTGAQIDAAVGAVASKADDTAVVHDTGNETIGGVKTFSSFPVTPSTAPTTNYQAANKKYIDDKVKTDVPVDAKFTDTVTTINGKTGAIAKEDITALGIPAQDTVYTHPSTAGNKHIPTGGATNQILKYSASGTAVWGDPVAGVTIVNGLTETVAGKALDAVQGKALNELVSTKSGKSTMQSKTLAAASWTGAVPPYSYSLSVTGVTTTSVQEILPTTDITSDQLSALISATIQDGGQSPNTIVLKAWGTKPTIDLPIRIILRGDM